MIIVLALKAAYATGIFALALSGIHHIILLILFFFYRRTPRQHPQDPAEWPSVTLQLPVYNERYVITRLIDAACRLEYPAGRLSIQVLDDSTDDTTAIAHERVAHHRMRGVDIQLYHREHRAGYKAGSLAEGLDHAKGELIAILDSDFVPPVEFLRQLVPYFNGDQDVGMVQARWGHLNSRQSWITRSQALALDAQFVIVQTARHSSGLFVKFNGSAGIWRKACIEDAGGWQADTLTEDMDLSIRAQMRGWKFKFAPEVIVPAELPAHLAAYKRQQYRWAHGCTNVLLRTGRALLTSPLPLPVRLDGLLQMFSYMNYLIVASLLLLWVPLMLFFNVDPPSVPWIFPLALAGPMILITAQWAVYHDWRERILYLPALLLLGVGLGLNNSLAVLSAILGKRHGFIRTPKGGEAALSSPANPEDYAAPVHWTLGLEVGIAGFAAAIALQLIPLDFWQALPIGYLGVSYGFVAVSGLFEASLDRLSSR